MSSPAQQQQRRRQIMQPWPLCLASFGKPKDKAEERMLKSGGDMPATSVTTERASPGGGKQYSRVAQDCASNSTLLTQVSPFSSQAALEAEQHYYADNLRSGQHSALNGSRIYDPRGGCASSHPLLEQPLLLLASAKHEHEHEHEHEPAHDDTRTLMESQDLKRPPPTLQPLKVPQFQKELRRRRPYYATQVLAAFAVSIGSMVVGFASSYTSPAIVSMEKDVDMPFVLTKKLESWIGSVMPLSALVGGIGGGALIEYAGRRNTILCLSLPFLVSWVMIGLASNVGMVLGGRALGGFCVGMLSLAMPVYLGETMQPEVRGTLGLMPTAFGNIGILLCNAAGIWLNWWQLALASALIPVPFAALMLLVPETPRWYVAKGRGKRARRALQWLRGRGADVSEELAGVERMHVDSERQAGLHSADSGELFKPANLRPLAISIGLMFFQQMSGINAVIFYTSSIFKMAAGKEGDGGNSTHIEEEEVAGLTDDQMGTLVVGVVNFVATFVAAAVIDRAGRKLLLYASSLSMIVSLAGLGVFFYLKDELLWEVDGWLKAVPVICLVVYVLGFSLGFGPVPWLMMGEILPARVRGSAASIVTSFNWSCTFVVTNTFVDLLGLLGSSGTFWLFGLVCVCGLGFVLLCVPETSGRSLEEIERGLTGQAVRRMSSVANIKPTPLAC